MFTPRTIAAFIVAGIVGTIVNSIAVSVSFGAPFLPLVFSFGREAVAIIVAILLPILFFRMPRLPAMCWGFVLLTIIPSILAKTVFAATAPWLVVLIMNGFYAIAAVATYIAITGPRGRRTA